ncbi:MAG: sugar ABC transporter permease, partial [Lachnospiraceae bacterium]|nr:sugar ABC transporter permease [Lachnospiraceae bacterium]
MEKTGKYPVWCSYIVMGTGQILYGQVIKGFLYLAVFASFIVYLVNTGCTDLIGLFTLGTVEGDSWLGIQGDDSVIMMLRGILAVMLIVFFLMLHVVNIRDVNTLYQNRQAGRGLLSFRQSVSRFIDKKFYVVALFLPVAGVLIFNVLPIVFMTLIAFTNYGGDIIPPKLVDWIGLANFKQIFLLSDVKKTFVKILGWNILWAVLSTFINYFGGLFLALLLNKKCVKGKAFWRAFPILAYAVPAFI